MNVVFLLFFRLTGKRYYYFLRSYTKYFCDSDMSDIYFGVLLGRKTLREVNI